MKLARLLVNFLANPVCGAITSICLIGIVFLAWSFPAADLTICEVQTMATPVIVACFAYQMLSAAMVHGTLVHTYVLFLGCATLFIGGRFVAHSLGFDVATLGHETTLFAVDRPDFVTISMSPKEALELSRFILICMLAIHAGYMAAVTWKPKNQTTRSIPDATIPLRFMAILLAGASATLFAAGFHETYAGIVSSGYHSLYMGNNVDFTLRATSAAQYGLLLAMGLAFASRTRWLEALTYVLLALYYAGSLVLGVRGGIMGFVLLTIWLFHTRVRSIGLIAAIGIPVALIGMLLLANLGIRAPHFGQYPIHMYLMWFMDNQGLSALYLHPALQIDHYPPLAYLHSVVPVVPAVINAFGSAVPVDQLYFGQYLSKLTLNGDAHQQGFGMGWSLLADFHAYTLGIPGLFSLAAAAFGWFLACFVNSTSSLAIGAHTMIFIKIMLLARSGLYSILPYLVAYACAIAVSHLIAAAYNKRRSGAAPNQVGS